MTTGDDHRWPRAVEWEKEKHAAKGPASCLKGLHQGTRPVVVAAAVLAVAAVAG